MVGRARSYSVYAYVNELILSHINVEPNRIHPLRFPHRQRIVDYESPQTENKFRRNYVQFVCVGIATAMTLGVRCAVAISHQNFCAMLKFRQMEFGSSGGRHLSGGEEETLEKCLS